MAEHIVRDGETGEAIVSSTGTRVDDILEAIDSTGSVDGALRRFPGLTTEGVSAALQFARVASRREMRYEPDPRHGVHELRETGVQFNAGGAATMEPGEYDVATARQIFGTPEDALRSAEATRERLLYELDLIESVRDGLQDVIDGNTIPHDEAVAWLRANIPG
jgi:uncharacterized protein (DUF433 family)